MSKNRYRQRKRAARQQAVPKRAVKPSSQLFELAKDEGFGSFAALCGRAKPLVYSITRMRPISASEAVFTTLGTGFLCGEARFLTAAHVLQNDGAKHELGDKYLLIQKDEFGNFHRALIEPALDEDLFIYSDFDTALIHLPESFYEVDGKVVKDRSAFLKLSAENRPLGTDVGVFGYPLQQLALSDDDVDMTPITLRVDKGVLNSGSRVNNVNTNEFTMAFNPGNSGGPIVDCRTGKVIAFVHGYNSIPTRFVKEEIPENQRESLGTNHIVTALRALYSIGICTTNLKDLESRHGLKLY